MVHLTDICKSFRSGEVRIQVLSMISLGVEPSETLAIRGPSGAGKTTLLTIMGLLDRPSSGMVRFLGDDPWAMPDRARSRIRARSIGFVFQNHNLINGLTVWRNVELPLKYGQAHSRRERRNLVDSALGRVGLLPRVRHLPRQISGGEAQRVAVARAIVGSPQLLLADEPTGNLDIENGERVLGLITACRSPGAAVVIVTHNPSIADRCDRAIHLSDGEVERNASQLSQD